MAPAPPVGTVPPGAAPAGAVAPAAAAVLIAAALLIGSCFLGQPTRNPEAGDSDGMILIPEGEAELGSGAEERAFGYRIGGRAARRWKWFDNERQRTVKLPAYRMDRTPVTQRAYGEFVRALGWRVPFITEEGYREQGYLVHPYDEVLRYLWYVDRPPAELAEHPVVLVSQPDAQTYCRWRGERTRAICRLPSEDEWEKAARGTGGRYFPWGDEWAPERVNTVAQGPFGTTPVGRYPEGRSPYGLYDMAGNVFEWTATPGRPGRTVVKSCSWDDFGGICRAAARHDRKTVSRHILFGFRCLCEIEADAVR